MIIHCRYVKWNLGRGIGLVARCEYDAIMPTQQGKVFINIKALNEWDSKVKILGHRQSCYIVVSVLYVRVHGACGIHISVTLVVLKHDCTCA